MQNEDDLLDVQYIAARLKVNPRTVLRMVEREELPAIRVARRLRFRRSDLEHYLATHLSTSSSATNESDKQIIAEAAVPANEAHIEDKEIESIFTAQLEPTPEVTAKEEIPLVAIQSTRLREQVAELEVQKKRLELEQKKLDLHKQHLDLHTRRIDHALDAVDRMVNLLPAEVDATTKVRFLQTLLPEVLSSSAGTNASSISFAPARGNEEEFSTPNGAGQPSFEQ
jgi:excisionase family DNA binding protein